MEEQPANSSSFFQSLTPQKRIVLIVSSVIILILYIGLNIGIWMYARTTKNAAQTIVGTNKTNSIPIGEIDTPFIHPSTIPSLPATPTPRLTGPGQYSCSMIGMCKLFDPAIQKANCTTTYADPNCLDQCQDKTKQCKI